MTQPVSPRVPTDVRAEIGSGIEFLGHKASQVGAITEAVGGAVGPRGRVADVFCGTATVSAALRSAGYTVDANDTLALCTTWAEARLQAPRTPTFAGLGLRQDPRYPALIEILNGLPPVKGFVWRNYSPASRRTASVARMYFTEDNAAQIDAVRKQIREWEPALTRGEHSLLLACLVDAVGKVSNIAGTYGCYLKEWKPRALHRLRLLPLRPGPGRSVGHRVTRGDAEIAAAQSSADITYADPPYTKRQYAAYYHVLETIVLDDEPAVTGSTALRPWRSQLSAWCYRSRATAALERLVAKASSPFLLLSYNDDGQIPHETILDVMSSYGAVQFSEYPQRRYRSSRLPHRGATVQERLYLLSR